MAKIRPLGDRVIVKRDDEAEQKSAGGIIIPDTAKEKPVKGSIVAVGSGAINDRGEKTPMEVKAGDKVLFSKYAGNEIKIDGEELLIMRENEILGILE